MVNSMGDPFGDSGTFRPAAFKIAEENHAAELQIRRLFEQGLPSPVQRTDFDDAFGEDPLDFLMCEFALPIYEAEMNRSLIERHGKPEQKVILPPADLSFDEVEAELHKQWSERTCPGEHYFKKFLNQSVMEALNYAVEEADRLGIVDDHRAFKLFCPLDHIAEYLWTHNEKHPERLNVSRQSIPIFTEFFRHFPRQEPPLHLRLTVEEAAVIIQKRWKGTMTRRRADIRALRRHIAAARIQYCNPRRLVNELWNRELHVRPTESQEAVSVEKTFKDYTRTTISDKITNKAPPPLPRFLQKMKAEIEKTLLVDKIKFETFQASDSDEDLEPEEKAPPPPPPPVETPPPVAPPPMPDAPTANPAETAAAGLTNVLTRKSLNPAGHVGGGVALTGGDSGKAGLPGGLSTEPKISKDKQQVGGSDKKGTKQARAK